MKFDSSVVTRAFSMRVLKAKKQSPHIFFGVGVVGSVASTVLACRATLQLPGILEEMQKDIASLNEVQEVTDSKTVFPYTQDEYRKHLAYIYGKGAGKIIKLYAPSFLIGATSIGLLTKSHVDLSKRNAALMAAYATVQKAYDDYRERVQDILGEEKELDVYHAVSTEKDGKNELRVADPNKWSPYAKMFDEYNDNWTKDPELNRLFIQCQQNYANDLLHAKGYVFLNDVYVSLGIPRTKAGQIVGWVVGEGDNYIDFGMFDVDSSRFVNGVERSIILDFNVDGAILDLI